MPHNLGRDFARLTRQTNPTDPRAPWWVNWLLQLAVMALVIWGLAAALDYGWQYFTGRSLGATCWFVTLLPIHWLLPLGSLAMFGGFILALFSSKRGAGLAWLIAGSFLFTAPEFIATSNFLRCASVNVL
jgi:hypothetical protein